MNRGNGGGFLGGGRARGPRRGGFMDHRGRGMGGPPRFGGRGGGFERRGGFGDFRPRGRGFGDHPRARGGFHEPWRGNRGFFPPGRGRFPYGGGPHRPPPPGHYDNQKYIFRKGNGNNYPRPPRSDTYLKRLTEVEVGITEYISKHEGFSGVIKQRFSDFQVNEIDCDGNVVSLTDVTVPSQPVQAVETTVKLEDVLPADTVEKLRNILTEEGKNSVVEINVTDISKEDRRSIHEAIRAEFGTKLNSNTKTLEDVKMLHIVRSNRLAKQDIRFPWPEDRAGRFVHFTLYKENMDTMEAVNFIASRFNMNPSNVAYAGTKDKRGMTCQKLSMFKVEPARLVEKIQRQKRISVGNFEFKASPLSLGSLKGNRFRIALRNVTGTEEQITQAVESLQSNGFINYYGLQRFGNSTEVPTYHVGKELLQGNWKGAVELILKPRLHECQSELTQARQVWWDTRFATKAFNILHRKDYSIEGKLLGGLVKNGETNFSAALDSLPRNTRLLYLHSYQSLVWNKVASRRLKELGAKPIVGDLVLLGDIRSEVFFDIPPNEENESDEKEKEVTEDTKMEVSEEAKEVTEEVKEVTEEVKKVTEDVVKTEPASEAEDKEEAPVELALAGDKIAVEQASKRLNVKTLTEEDLADYDITDIVLPLPGFDIELPSNEVKDWYEEFLKEDGLTIASLKQKIRKYSLGGAYRKIVIKPENFSWRLATYNSPEQTLQLSDLEVLESAEALKLDEEPGTYKALLLDFHLPSSSYATMALRDVLKQDTSSGHQRSLNTYNEKVKPDGLKRKETDEATETEAKKQKIDETADAAEPTQDVELEAKTEDNGTAAAADEN